MYDYYIYYNSYLLSEILRTQRNYFNYRILKKKNNSLNYKLSVISNDYIRLKRKYSKIKDTSDSDSCCSNFPNKKKKINSRYNIIDYPLDANSWSDEQINETLKTMINIDDIISLEPYIDNIKHNKVLQKLSNLIPPLKKLSKMIGLKNIKENLFKQIIYYVTNSYQGEYLHTIILGPPGVGKTEFAKIYADVFVRLNILKSDTFVEARRDSFIAGYLGQTAIKTKKLLDSALNGVLFLDEAYSMGNNENRDSFSKEAIDTINQYLSEKKDKLMFIIAGYESDIENCFFAYNKGLHRRFQTKYEITSYTSDELLLIFLDKIMDCGYDITELNKDTLKLFFNDNSVNFINFAGDIEKLVNEVKQIQSMRVFKLHIFNKNIIMADIKTAFDNLFDNVKKNKPPVNLMMYI